ncbi:DUF2878 domain-containing protein [Luteimonas sp. 50]|uniref:DUF2878 domain-containing protein n=1 Tax=Cognatiluteimonas sedimenti TaxID=2927791 RepID=A0ABT0A167_9GAMM|nr:DUF2878 domain-containing protein [Lysobacter sedimenti]MCJ0824718.1 DUF2878 domain-containing protein [Lysobacter sedimenti]
MRPWSNLLGYQATWLAVVWSAGQGRAWVGMAASVLFIAMQGLLSRTRSADGRALLAAAACGLVVDGSLAASGLLVYASPGHALPAPEWILFLWAAFAMTMNHSMPWFASHRLVAAGLGALGGPLAYIGAARGFGAVTFATPAWRGLACLAVAWEIALPWLLRVATDRRVAEPLAPRART